MTNSLLSPLSFTSWFDAATGDVITVDVYFYNAGTDTEVTVYTDGLLQIAHDQPVRTGGSGRLPPVFVSETPTLYRFRAYDVDGVLLEDVDNLPGAQPDADSVPPPLDLDYDGFLAVGDIIARFGMPIARTGFVLCNGGTIGSAGSSATELAGDDALALFTWLWEQDDAGGESLTISGGRGADAATDWAANKTITVPDLRGRVIAGLDQMDAALAASRLTTTFFGSAGLTSGLVGGSQNHLLTTAELAAHTHANTAASTQLPHQHITSSNNDHTHSYTGPVDLSGSGFGLQAGSTAYERKVALALTAGLMPTIPATGGISNTLTGFTDILQPLITTTMTNASAGTGDAHNNLQPTMTLVFYIRAPVYVP